MILRVAKLENFILKFIVKSQRKNNTQNNLLLNPSKYQPLKFSICMVVTTLTYIPESTDAGIAMVTTTTHCIKIKEYNISIPEPFGNDELLDTDVTMVKITHHIKIKEIAYS